MADTQRSTVNEALLAVGEPGKYHLLLLMSIFVPGALTSIHTLVVVLSQAGMAYSTVILRWAASLDF
ncbi:hypothetical protein EB796_013880 [Bugula neritina]|uniref:Uncharacterized protein n=1 Tax=Bugula neritina TaxID=10212 RepID=A0A7J7JN83_BUGNE|nr:hypothetical protein EB796_013880 [Bugula neritina]